MNITQDPSANVKTILAAFTQDDGQSFNFQTATDYHAAQRAIDLAWVSAPPFDRVWLEQMERRVQDARPAAPNEYALDEDMIEAMNEVYALDLGYQPER